MHSTILQRIFTAGFLIILVGGAAWYGQRSGHGGQLGQVGRGEGACVSCADGIRSGAEAWTAGVAAVNEAADRGAGAAFRQDNRSEGRRGGWLEPRVLLPARQTDDWGRPAAGAAVFEAFRGWVGRWEEALASGVGVAALEAEGVVLARERRRVLADLVQGDPAGALRVAVPYGPSGTSGVRSRLPGSVVAWLETWVNDWADVSVACAVAVPGRDERSTRLVRWAEWDGVRARVFVDGGAVGWGTTVRGVPIYGILLPADAGTNPLDQEPVAATQMLALSASPARQLERDEIPAGSDGAIGLEMGGEITFYPGEEEARAAVAAAMAAPRPTGEEAGDEGSLAGAGVGATGSKATATATASGPVSAAGLPVAESARTEGYKRLLFLRVDFPDFPGEQATIPLAEAQTLLGDMRNYALLMSYGLHGIAPIGSGGSAVTPVLRMGMNSSNYDNEGLSRLYPEARAKAAAAGIDLSKFDYDGVFTKGRPAAGYAGLAYVGAPGFHMANGYFGKHVTTHEYGHNLGLPHAHRWETDDKSIIGPGTLVEYGNRYDPMGEVFDSIPGEKHFTGGYKNYLDWIPDADAVRITTSGVYRLTTSDAAQSRGRRVLRVRKDARDYWVEFRDGLNDPLLANGVFLQWGNPDGNENYLLDVLPGVSGTTLTVGRTFSDPGANNGVGVHLTPLGKGGTFPESMDVRVTIGTAVGNRPPVAEVTANTVAAPAGTPVVLAVAATDPDGDELAYAWDFGDGGVSTDNAPEQTHRFSAAGDYRVQCTVSDMRGGTFRSSVMVRVETSSFFRIAGRALDVRQRPVAGLQVVAANGSERRRATTDSAGSYVLTNVSAGAWTVTARETLADTLNCVMPFHTNPLRVGPSVEGVDFVASSGPQETVTPLVAKRATWKWFAQGKNPPTGWNAMAFDDASWEEGAGVLGYGNESGQATTIPFGPSSTAKWTGSFFRRAFELDDPSRFPALRLEVLRDDGVVVYLNGHEIFRDNLPTGPVAYTTQAGDAIEPDDYLVRTLDVASALPRGLLVAGTNYLTASVHQAGATSSDLAFDAALSGVAPLAGVGDAVVYLTTPLPGATALSMESIVSLSAVARVKNDTVAKVVFYGDGAVLGEDDTAPFQWDWASPAAGPHTAHVVAFWTGGGTEASVPVAFTVEPPLSTLVAAKAVWKYRAVNSAAPAGWTQREFDDTSWAAGPAPLGFGDGDEATIIPSGTPTSRPLTSYFRHVFVIDDPAAVSGLVARLVRDDGALVWLNGVEVIRSNLPTTGTMGYSVLATGAGPSAIDNAEYSFPLDAGMLVSGPNVLAVEVHQSDATSSDLSFQLALEGRLSGPRPRGLSLQAPAVVAAPQPVVLRADGVAGGGLGLARVQFRADGVVLGDDLAAPFEFMWSSPPVGGYALTAVAWDTAGGVLTSGVENLRVDPPPTGVALVSFGESWRYLDEGTAPAASWRARTGFDDSGWAQGLGRLGYGGDGEATVVGYGSQTSARHITTWLRKKFIVGDRSGWEALRLRLVRDDGVVVSLNGTEVFRSNLPDGVVTPTTLATTDIAGAAEAAVVEARLPLELLVAGENVLAVELHQAGPASSDLGFDLELIALGSVADDFYFASPAASQSVSAAVDLPLSVWVAPELGVTRVEYFAGPARLGDSDEAPYFPLTWTTPVLGSFELTARAVAADGRIMTAGPLTLTVEEPRVSALHVPAGSVWKYWDTGTLPAASWNRADYVDTAWKSGAARLGFGADRETTAIQSGHMTYYFRKTFSISSLASVGEVGMRFQRDDGVVVYLNGVEVFRDNMPAGLVGPTTPATTEVTDEQAWWRRVLPASGFQVGQNLLAVEVHQRRATSSDVGWDAEVSSRGVNLLAVANSAPSAAPFPEFSVLAGPGGVVDGWQFGFDETSGRLYVIERSDDLKTWLPEAYEFARDGRVEVRLPAGPPVMRAYYRARWLSNLP